MELQGRLGDGGTTASPSLAEAVSRPGVWLSTLPGVFEMGLGQEKGFFLIGILKAEVFFFSPKSDAPNLRLQVLAFPAR